MAKNAYLGAMGIPVWKSRRNLPFAKQIEQEMIASDSIFEESGAETIGEWELLQQQVAHCSACDLYHNRKNTVFGVGNLQADWMIVGEAPGEAEEARGEPFVGPAGQMLTQMLLAIGISREKVFIANILKCRPPENRDPKQDEGNSCQHFLIRQINMIKPKIILAVGRVAAQNLLHSKELISRIRGNTYILEETQTPLIATYHPAYLLRSPTEKSKVWADLVLAKKVLEGRL